MEYTPKPQNRKPQVAAVVLILLAAMLFFFSRVAYVKLPALAQALGFVCLSVAAFFIIKRITVYTYTVFPKDRDTKRSVSELSPDELVLTISKSYGGASRASRASLDLGRLESVTKLPFRYSEKNAAIKKLGKMSLYYYTVTFRPSESYLLLFKERGAENVGVVIEPDGDLLGFFEEAARLNAKED